jgi:hypothetical protein
MFIPEQRGAETRQSMVERPVRESIRGASEACASRWAFRKQPSIPQMADIIGPANGVTAWNPVRVCGKVCTVNSTTLSTSTRKRRALMRVSLIVIMMLMIPVVLYTIVPEEPIKEGMIVYASATHRAYFEEPERYRNMGYAAFCILEPQLPLVVIRTASDGSLAARSDTKSRAEVPFCPPHAVVTVQMHQIIHKQSLWIELKHVLASFFGG